MKFGLKSRYPHKWEKITSKDDDGEFLVRKFNVASLMDATSAAGTVSSIATKLEMESQVHLSIYSDSFWIFIHFTSDKPVQDSHYELADAIENELSKK